MDLKAFGERFRARCRDDLAKLLALENEGLDLRCADTRETVVRIAHRIAGAAGMFGFADLGTAASELESEIVATNPDLARAETKYSELLLRMHAMTRR